MNKGKIINIIIWIIILTITYNYLSAYNNLEVRYNQPQMKGDKIISLLEYEKIFGSRSGIIVTPVYANTIYNLEISEVGDNYYKTNFKGTYYSDRRIILKKPFSIKKWKVLEPPEIFFNERELSLIENTSSQLTITEEGTYENWEGEVFQLPTIEMIGNKTLNTLAIENLLIHRNLRYWENVKIPFFFNKTEYTTVVVLPKFPIIFSQNQSAPATITINYNKHKRIDPKYSGWQKYYLVEEIIPQKIDETQIKFFTNYEANYNGTINQEVIHSSDSKIVFTTEISKDNFPYNFKIIFLPPLEVYFIPLLFLWMPLLFHFKWLFFLDPSERREKLLRPKKSLPIIYAIILGILGISSITTLELPLWLIKDSIRYINKYFLIFVLIFPILYIVFINYLEKKKPDVVIFNAKLPNNF